jgi:hypothetical protein
VVPPAWLAWANQACPLIDAHLEAVKFCDYWQAASGRNATKHDWQATWRNWIRNAHPSSPYRRPGEPSPTRETAPSLSPHGQATLVNLNRFKAALLASAGGGESHAAR